MKINRKIQEVLLKYGGFIRLIKRKGIITIVDFAIVAFINIISKRFYKFRKNNYGFLEALFHSRDIDRWSRYAYVVDEIKKIRTKNILEVGSGGEGVTPFLSRDCEVFLSDVRKDVFHGLKAYHIIVSNGCKLPFRDNAFDVVISVDTAEHIPRSIRHNFYRELRRVCRRRIILTCPIQSDDNTFQGRTYDIIFQSFYEKLHGFKEPNTQQHIDAGHPTLDEIKTAFPNAQIHGYKNCDIWLKYMLFSRRPLIGLFCGLLYYLFWKREDIKPPYWGAIITVDS